LSTTLRVVLSTDKLTGKKTTFLADVTNFFRNW